VTKSPSNNVTALMRSAADRITGEIAAALNGRPLAEVRPIRTAAGEEEA
jgi:hypothetical protein